MAASVCIALLVLASAAAAQGHVYTEGHELLNIGALLDDDMSRRLNLEEAFQVAVRQQNLETYRIMNNWRNVFNATVQYANAKDSLGTRKRVCRFAEELGVTAVFGCQPGSVSGVLVQAMTEDFNIPYISVCWDPSPPPASFFHTNLYPSSRHLSKALADILVELKWRTYSVLYEDDDALWRLKDVLQARQPSDLPVVVRRFEPGVDRRVLFKELKANSMNYVVLDCATENILDILRDAASVNMLGVYQSYLITSLDSNTVDFSEFQDSGANITTIRLLDPRSESIQKAVTDLKDRVKLTPSTIKVETALMMDAVALFANAVFSSTSSGVFQTEYYNCTSDRMPHSYGKVIADYMRYPGLKSIEVNPWIDGLVPKGLTGSLGFDKDTGERLGYTITVLEFSKQGFQPTATWDPENYFQGVRSDEDNEAQIITNLQTKLIIVSSRIGSPYLRDKPARDPPRIGNDRYEGFSMDLIKAIANISKFEFEFQIAPFNAYGKFDPVSQQWIGMLGEVIKGNADLAVGDLTITYDREKVVDFSMPFMNLGISILYKRSEKPDPNLFSFLEPFTIDVWICMATAYLGVSVLLFIQARTSPGEWNNPHPCNADPEELENSYTMINCLWFSIGSLMAQGCDILPKSVSTRMLAGMWWFFVLIMISSYTAKLAAFLTVSKMDMKIRSAEDLAKQVKIKYGALKDGATANFFKNSNTSLYQRMWTAMDQARPAVLTKDNDEGVERVKKGKGDFAFFMESTSIEYQTERNCDLIQVGGLLDSKGYGIALPIDSPFRTHINRAILLLQEQGRLQELKERWWKPEGGSECHRADAAVENSDELGILNVGGVFLVLLSGTVSALLVAVLEFLWNCRKIAVEDKITPWEAIKHEVKFAIRCSAKEKPVKRKTDEDSTDGASFERLQPTYDKFDIDPK